MNFRRWIFPKVDKQSVSEAAEDCGVDPLIVFIAFARGLCEPYEIERFIEKDPDFTDPYEYSGMSEAVNRINIALESDERILVFGDYDCDGVTATSLLIKYLKSRGANADYCVPDRQKDGYGISVGAVEKAAENGYSLIITVDNGINAVNEVKRANELGIDVVITDHHLPKGDLPDAVAVVDPNMDAGCDWIFKELCGVGVAFKLVCALEGRPCEEMIYEYADLVMLGTIADVVPLVGENRIIVGIGLDIVRRRLNKGIKALIDVTGSKYISASNVAFTLCPRINAAGRMASAETAIKLLLSDNQEDAAYYAGCLDRLNAERQETEQGIFDKACLQIEKNGYDKDSVIVVEGHNWHIGVIGIVASKLMEKYGKPCIVINADGEKSVGSGRSISGFSLFDALSACSEKLVKFGGHELAAGITLNEDDIADFRKEINAYASEFDMPFAALNIDCRIKPRALTVDAAKALKALEPYGSGNPVPLFAVMESQIVGIQPLSGGKHIRLKLKKENSDYYAVMFGMTPEDFKYRVGETVDIAVTLDVNVYNDTESASVIVKAIRKSGIDEDKMIQQLRALEKMYRGCLNPEEAALICPERSDIAAVFRYIQAQPDVKHEFIENDLSETVGFGKLTVALTALEELGIIKKNEGSYSLTGFNGKADLNSAVILANLHKVAGR